MSNSQIICFDSGMYPISITFIVRKLIAMLRNSLKEILRIHSLLKCYNLFESSIFLGHPVLCKCNEACLSDQ